MVSSQEVRQMEKTSARPGGRVWVWPVCFWLAAAVWLVGPLVRPHGEFFWGHHTFLGLFLDYSSLPLRCARPLWLYNRRRSDACGLSGLALCGWWGLG